jgi:hypothetical protein
MRAAGSAHKHELIFRFDAFGNGVAADCGRIDHDRCGVIVSE